MSAQEGNVVVIEPRELGADIQKLPSGEPQNDGRRGFKFRETQPFETIYSRCIVAPDFDAPVEVAISRTENSSAPDGSNSRGGV